MCEPLSTKYRNFQLLYRSPFLRIQPLWSGSPIWSRILCPDFNGLTMTAPFGASVLALGVEVVRLRRSVGSLCSFSFSLDSFGSFGSLGSLGVWSPWLCRLSLGLVFGCPSDVDGLDADLLVLGYSLERLIGVIFSPFSSRPLLRNARR